MNNNWFVVRKHEFTQVVDYSELEARLTEGYVIVYQGEKQACLDWMYENE